ncbi:MAG TPA: hypothetical protein VHD81_07830 [Mycobacteriales bacterium]|nr:hypothetical protein [Mycobacteriales bacterium]
MNAIAIPFALVGVLYGGIVGLSALRASSRSPAGIVRRLFQTGQPVVIDGDTITLLWDPSRPIGRGGFAGRGSTTYTLEPPNTIRAWFVPASGPAVESCGVIPDVLMPDPPEARRRRRIARAIIALYVFAGVVAFVLPAELVDGSTAFKVRVGALSAVGLVTMAWFATHLLLVARRTVAEGATAHPLLFRLRHLAAWFAGMLVVSAALAVAWRLGDTGQPGQTTTSWPNAFISTTIFVFTCTAMVAATTHHHHYVHHTDSKSHDGSG